MGSPACIRGDRWRWFGGIYVYVFYGVALWQVAL